MSAADGGRLLSREATPALSLESFKRVVECEAALLRDALGRARGAERRGSEA